MKPVILGLGMDQYEVQTNDDFSITVRFLDGSRGGVPYGEFENIFKFAEHMDEKGFGMIVRKRFDLI